jgi:iron(II)-dependent oxidoreductase
MRNARMAYEAARDAWNKRYSIQGNYELALAEFKRVSTEYFGTPYAERAREMRAHIHFEWATSLEKENSYEKAVEHYREALKVAPEGSQYREDAKKHLPRALARRADYCMQRGLYEDALEIYHRIKKEFPGAMESRLLAKREPQILLNQAVIYWQQQTDLDAALARFRRLIEEYPQSEAAEEARGDLPQLHLDIARERIKNGNLEGALEELATLREVFPESGVGQKATELEADVLYQLFHRARAAGKEAEAQKRFAALTERHPHSKWAQKALRQQLDLMAPEGQVLLNETTARNRVEEAQRALAQMNYETALNKFRAVVRYTSPQSKAGRKALDMIPECIYRRGLHERGLGQKETFREKLQQVQNRFSYSPWADRAAKTLRQSQNVPEGMLFVPEGRFYMGAQKDRIIEFMEPFYPQRVMQSEQELSLVLETVGYTSEMPRHIARTDSIYMDRTEVTNEQYKEFLDETERPPPADWPGKTYREGEGQMPVTGVSYDDARAYAEWAGKRLPTEAEWEKAARGVDGRFFPWGNVFDRSACRHMRQNGAGPAEVGSYPNGASPYGVLDLTGNVWEWTSSPFEPYPDHTGRDERAPYSSDYRVLRGGAWPQHDIKPIPTRLTFRSPARPDRQSARLGFRCVQDAK